MNAKKVIISLATLACALLSSAEAVQLSIPDSASLEVTANFEVHTWCVEAEADLTYHVDVHEVEDGYQLWWTLSSYTILDGSGEDIEFLRDQFEVLMDEKLELHADQSGIRFANRKSLAHNVWKALKESDLAWDIPDLLTFPFALQGTDFEEGQAITVVAGRDQSNYRVSFTDTEDGILTGQAKLTQGGDLEIELRGNDGRQILLKVDQDNGLNFTLNQTERHFLLGSTTLKLNSTPEDHGLSAS